jgi:hypothetical protein
VFDDFQWAAKYLISEKFVAKDKVAVSGGSNGGEVPLSRANLRRVLTGSRDRSSRRRLRQPGAGTLWSCDCRRRCARYAEVPTLHDWKSLGVR